MGHAILIVARAPALAETNHQVEVPVGVRPAEVVAFTARGQLLLGELTNRFEQSIA